MPEWATLLDVLELVKDRHDGTLAYRRSCRMMICGSCAMRIDGADGARLQAADARSTRRQGKVPVISPMGNLPIVKDLVVDMEPFWAKFRAVDPYLQPGLQRPARRARARDLAAADGRDPQGVALHQLRRVRVGVQRDGVEPRLPRPAGAREGDALRRRPARRRQERAAREAVNGEHGIWECTRCYFCNERCPKGVDPRDAIAKLGAESIKEGIDRDMGAKHAKWFVDVGQDDRLAARDRARAEDAGHRRVDQADEVRARPRQARQGADAVPAARREGRAESRRLHDLLREQDQRRLRGHRPGREGAREARARRARGARRPVRAGLVPAAVPAERAARSRQVA